MWRPKTEEAWLHLHFPNYLGSVGDEKWTTLGPKAGVLRLGLELSWSVQACIVMGHACPQVERACMHCHGPCRPAGVQTCTGSVR